MVTTKTLEQMAEEYAEDEQQYCRCAGPTCSGCEAKTSKVASADYLAGAIAALSLPEVSVIREALQYYSEMRYNQTKAEWMPGNPDKAKAALSLLENLLTGVEK